MPRLRVQALRRQLEGKIDQERERLHMQLQGAQEYYEAIEEQYRVERALAKMSDKKRPTGQTKS